MEGSGDGPGGLTPCKYNEDIQPVGGRVQAKYRDEMNSKREEIQEATMAGLVPANITAPATTTATENDEEQIPLGKSVYVEDYTNELALDAEKERVQQNLGKTVYEMPYDPDFHRRGKAVYVQIIGNFWSKHAICASCYAVQSNLGLYCKIDY